MTKREAVSTVSRKTAPAPAGVTPDRVAKGTVAEVVNEQPSGLTEEDDHEWIIPDDD